MYVRLLFNTPFVVYRLLSTKPSVNRLKQAASHLIMTIVDMLSLQSFGTTNPKEEGFEWLFGKAPLDEAFDDAIREMSKPDEEVRSI